jgi:hypothetical protein
VSSSKTLKMTMNKLTTPCRTTIKVAYDTFIEFALLEPFRLISYLLVFTMSFGDPFLFFLLFFFECLSREEAERGGGRGDRQGNKLVCV